MKKWFMVLTALIAVLALACPACLASGSQTTEELHADIQHEINSPEWVRNLPAAQDANQLFVVAAMGMDKTTAFISMHRKDENGEWKQILSTPGFVGKNGLCPDGDHAEGCGQTPVGVYHFNKVISTKLSASPPTRAAPCRTSRWMKIRTGPAIRTGSITRWWTSGTCRTW